MAAANRCHYRGRLASNNAVFDSSYERGRPLSFKARAAVLRLAQCVHATGVELTAPCAALLHNSRLLLMTPKARGAVQIGVGQVIKGWDLGIAGGDGVPPMKVRSPAASSQNLTPVIWPR